MRLRVVRATDREWDVFGCVDDSDPACRVEEQIGRIRYAVPHGRYIAFAADWDGPGQPELPQLDGPDYPTLHDAAAAIAKARPS